MGILKKLKSVLGMDGPGRPRARSDPEVTIEREPSTETEQAVKGSGPDDAPRAPRSASASATEAGETGETATASPATDADDAASVGDDAGTDAGAVTDDSPTVDEVNGIGPTYAERLEAAGIETVADLADSDPETVAEAAQTNESRAEDWLAQARDW